MLLAALSLVLVYTLAPFDFISASAREVFERTGAALDVRATGGLLKLAGHFAAFVVVGVLAAAAHRPWFLRSGWLPALAIAAVGCAGLESIQLLHAFRHARVTDFLVNLSGVCLGASLALNWSALGAGGRSPQRWTRGAQLAFHGAVLGLATMVWSAAGVQPVVGGLALGWDDQYPLLIGTEADGTRAWSGEIRYLGIYGNPLNDAQVSRLYRSLIELTPRESYQHGLLAGYDLTYGSRCSIQPDGLLHSTDHLVLRATGSQRCDPEGGGDSVAAGAFISEGSASALSRLISSREAFSVEAWIRPVDLVQRGHARIVTVSNGGANRNFTLGQSGEGFVFRVRNAITGPNATYYPLVAGTAARTEWQHVVAVYDSGVSVLYLNGTRLPPLVNLRQPTVFLGIGSDLRSEAAGGTLLAILLALPALGLLRGWTDSRAAHPIVFLAVLVVGGAPYLFNGLSLHTPSVLGSLVRLTLVLAAVYPLVVRYTTRGFSLPG